MERKVKYEYSFKLECLKLVLEKHYSCNYASIEKGVERSNLRKWFSFYNEFHEKIIEKWINFFILKKPVKVSKITRKLK